MEKDWVVSLKFEDMTKSFSCQDNVYKCHPWQREVWARDIALNAGGEVFWFAHNRPAHWQVTLIFCREGSGFMTLFSSGFLVTLSKSLLHCP